VRHVQRLATAWAADAGKIASRNQRVDVVFDGFATPLKDSTVLWSRPAGNKVTGRLRKKTCIGSCWFEKHMAALRRGAQIGLPCQGQS